MWGSYRTVREERVPSSVAMVPCKPRAERMLTKVTKWGSQKKKKKERKKERNIEKKKRKKKKKKRDAQRGRTSARASDSSLAANGRVGIPTQSSLVGQAIPKLEQGSIVVSPRNEKKKKRRGGRKTVSHQDLEVWCNKSSGVLRHSRTWRRRRRRRGPRGGSRSWQPSFF